MRIRYLSDLHLEFIKPNQIQNFIKRIVPLKYHQYQQTSNDTANDTASNITDNTEVLVLAGDIGNPYQENYHIFMQHVSKNFKKTFCIAGNHEYYGKKKMEETREHLKTYFKQYDNISFLDNQVEMYENYRFIGTTMWSHVSNPEYEINDVYSIPGLNYKTYNKMNEECLEFLNKTLETTETTKNNIIITHHQPSYLLVDRKYKEPKMNPYNQWFYCDMDNFIIKNSDKITCWIYGHTHTALNSFVNSVPTYCNPVGYPGENTNVDYEKYFMVI